MDPEVGHHYMGLVFDLRTVSDIWRDQVLEEATHLAAGTITIITNIIHITIVNIIVITITNIIHNIVNNIAIAITSSTSPL